MIVNAVVTRRFVPPQDSLDVLIEYLKHTPLENTVICISSKVIGVCEGLCTPVDSIDKQDLQKEVSDRIIIRKK